MLPIPPPLDHLLSNASPGQPASHARTPRRRERSQLRRQQGGEAGGVGRGHAKCSGPTFESATMPIRIPKSIVIITLNPTPFPKLKLDLALTTKALRLTIIPHPSPSPRPDLILTLQP